MTNQEANIIIGACNILDVIKNEWGAAWSEWDQSVRDGLSKMLATIYSARESTKRGWMGARSQFDSGDEDCEPQETVEDTLAFIRQCVVGRCDVLDLQAIRDAIDRTIPKEGR